jgi:hypothetical protein
VGAVRHAAIDYIVFTLNAKLDFKLLVFFLKGEKILLK